MNGKLAESKVNFKIDKGRNKIHNKNSKVFKMYFMIE